MPYFSPAAPKNQQLTHSTDEEYAAIKNENRLHCLRWNQPDLGHLSLWSINYSHFCV